METKAIYTKLLEFQNSVDKIKKDGKNPHFKNTYATLGQILGEVKPILNALKLVLTQPLVDNGVSTVITCSESGQMVESNISLPDGLNAQQMGSAITYYRRYTLSSLLALEMEDDDANLASPKAPEFVSTTHDKEWLNKFTDKTNQVLTDKWNAAVAFIKEGHTIAEIEVKYKLSKENKAELIQIQNNG